MQSASTRHDPYAPLRIPVVRNYLLGWLLLSLSGQVRSLVIAVEIYERTHNPASLGISGLMFALPILLFSLPGGAVADRFDRRGITLISVAVTTCLTLLLSLLSHLHAPIWSYYAVLFLIGTSFSLGAPARSAMLPNMVPPNLLASATTWNASTFQTASIAGPILGGALLYFGYPACYLLCALLASGFFLMLLQLETSPPKGKTPTPTSTSDTPPPTSDIRPSPLTSLLQGLRFVYSTKILFATILLDLLAVILGGVVYVLPVFQKEILHVSDFQLGLLRSAEFIGALLCGLVVAHLPPFKRSGLAFLSAVFVFGLCIIAFGLSKNFYLSFALLLVAGACDNISVIVRHTLVGLLAPDHMRGRINAVNTVFIGSSNELGGFRAGTMARLLGPVHSVVLGGFGTLASVVTIALVYPQIRRLGPLEAPVPSQEESASETQELAGKNP